ncbi:MAG: elongation factor P maturation arginine rhamnosyltransferase EarP [Hydrogenophilales bacterium CG17_big_fil_post_rev_8_21_14_2_50_63_12]|nr:MAG: elongation factor P maturation arginine rhamnosyltransferase EarP [Hydrogenophilales bacterium CG17_big_fil_post_rev_8_21_14_2_50_63_12]PIX97465.1 MAG: elongation factor P maturation arginine rhamnosyltransferase EarP [Hydrogenophilales bacterium CG_4_10_14_3_um_filter_63_21]PJB05035.1 MAG: elongation factor P maturation arginine rhamnosyltransferase EarP [Hydrogenophilales bacterium CG_4_9_14_3_um_filter_63_34]
MRNPSAHWDIFCSVIDNFGDIGVAWRLARQLATEYTISVRLWVDNLAAFHHIYPEINVSAATQFLYGVEIRQWATPLPAIEPGCVVIEALACHLPSSFIQAMAEKSPPPVWINLEYLSAENWVAGVHGLPSPHPRLPLTQYFFMPGYIMGTGGLPREDGLYRTRDDFQRNSDAQSRFWASLGLPEIDERRLRRCLRISLFSYESAALASLLTACSQGDRPIDLVVPWGKAVPQITAWFAAANVRIGDTLRRGNVQVHVLPMLSQDDYDRLLWACDCNFVRGEDSFVRAQFAARPLIWQAYRQEEGAHTDKLDAFLDRYCADLPPAMDHLVREMWQAWNREEAIGALWPAWIEALPLLSDHARDWATQLAEQPDLASNLVKFINKLLKYRAF